jgi:predicted MFS family arabinose efflux permease
MLLFALWMGVTYMAALPPTSGLIARRYGTANLSTLLGLTMLFHQAASFLGVWLGGVAFEASGHYDWMWMLDIALALAAVAVHLPLREGALARPLPGAARAAA